MPETGNGSSASTPKLQIHELGVMAISFGQKDDPDRIEHLLKGLNYKHPLQTSLDPEYWPHIDQWPVDPMPPEPLAEEELVLINFGCNLTSYYQDVLKAIQAAHYAPQGLCQLAAIGQDTMKSLLEDCGIKYIIAASLMTLCRRPLNTFVPCLNCNPAYPDIFLHDLDNNQRNADWFAEEDDWFLVGPADSDSTSEEAEAEAVAVAAISAT